VLASDPPEIDSKAFQEAFVPRKVATVVLATDVAYLHRQWRFKDPKIRAGVTLDW